MLIHKFTIFAEYFDNCGHLGGLWRMPTPSECEALTSSCTLTWVVNFQYGPADFAGPGYRVISKVNSYIYVFLPASGCYNGTRNDNDSAYNENYIVGIYWTSLPVDLGHAYHLLMSGL